MTHEDEIIFEQRFPYINLKTEERNYIINLLKHTKDVSDSEIEINENCEHQFDLFSLRLKKAEGRVEFEAIVCNSSENRILNGIINRKLNKYNVIYSVYRCSDAISDEEKEYIVREEFIVRNNTVKRTCEYINTGLVDQVIFEDEIELFTEEETENYIQDKTNKLKLARN